jgi:LCP family protein required for cell wall assembly
MQNKKQLIVLISASAAAAMIIVTLIVLNLRLNNLAESIEAQKTLLIEESTGYRENDDYLNQISRMLSLDINQTRASLGLPVTEYPSKQDDISREDSGEDTVFYDSISVLMKAEDDNRKSAAIGEFIKSGLINVYLKENKLDIVKMSDTETWVEWNKMMLIRLFAESGNDLVISNFSGETLTTRTASKETVFFIEKSLVSLKKLIIEKERLVEALGGMKSSMQINDACGELIRMELGNDGSLVFSNEMNSNTIRVWLDDTNSPVYRLTGSNESFIDTETLEKALLAELESFDLRTEEEVLIDISKMEIEKIFDDDEFKSYLQGMNLSVNNMAREDNDYIYYDILHSDGSRLGSFSILKKLGDIYLVDADEVPVSSLKTINIRKELNQPSGRKMIIPENIPSINNLYTDEDSITFLLVGAHELNTDTMIIVHADKKTGKAFMIGVPRDLYWKGRKINSIYQYFGPAQLTKELSEITGLNIANYIIVDMYAFIDIINILGGIEVTLYSDLIDPTYRTRENGEWSTLNYPKGTYRLNGVEALRIARSRHGSNDFDRSQRQQLIIEAFLNRFREFNITDVDKVYSLIQAMYQYVDTDLSLFDMMSVYNNYGESELAGRHVLSFDNILYTTYSNIYLLDEKDAKLIPDNKRGAWILLPEKNDWNNIRWYVRQIINGEVN